MTRIWRRYGLPHSGTRRRALTLWRQQQCPQPHKGRSKMSPITQAIQRGMARGMSLAANPTIENYRELRTPISENITAQAWSQTVEALEEAMRNIEERE